MTTLIFMLTVLTLLVLLVIVIIKLVRGKPAKSAVRKMIFIMAAYGLIWAFFYVKSTDVPIPIGTDVCFDDWCATILQAETGPAIQKQFSSIGADSTWVILHVKMSNHARGIAQKPSEPRIHMLDDNNKAWPYSIKGQQQLETTTRSQPDIGQRLELGQSVETMLVFAVPARAKNLKALIEEGPFITNFLFPEDRSVFLVH